MIIGLCGLKRSGKDTTADYLVENYGFLKYSLADPMKKAIKEIFLFNDEQLWGDKKEVIDRRYGVTPRQILQVFGTELMQYDIHEHLPDLKIQKRKMWVERFRKWYTSFLSYFAQTYEMTGEDLAPPIVISDVRFPHEVEVLEEMGAKIVRVVRYPLPGNDDKHISETEQLEIEEDYTLYGMDNIPTLYKEIDKLMKELNIKKI